MQLRKPDEQIQPLNSLKLKALNLSAWSSSYIFPIESIKSISRSDVLESLCRISNCPCVYPSTTFVAGGFY